MPEYSEYHYHNSEPTWSYQYIFDKIISVLDKNINKVILDIGCGNGSLAIKLIQSGYNVYGIDASISGINIAKKFYPERFFVSNIDDANLPSPLQELQFDTVITTEVIEHLYDPISLIGWIKTFILKSKGMVILTTPYHGYFKNILIALTGKWDSHHSVLWEGGHIKFFSRKTLSKLLTDSGFRNIKFYGCGRFPYLWKSMLITGELYNAL